MLCCPLLHLTAGWIQAQQLVQYCWQHSNNVDSTTLHTHSCFQQPSTTRNFYACTQQKTHNLFWPDENSIEQCCAAHIVQGFQQYWTSWWAWISLQSGVTMLNNIVDIIEQCGQQNTVQCCFHQVVRFLLCTQQKTHNLFWPDENRIEQCCAAHIVQGCQQHWTSWWAWITLQSGVTMLNNIVDNIEQCG